MPDYAAAAKRHFDDAKHLQAEERLVNADHLYGFSVECALKAILKETRILELLPDGRPTEKTHRKHADGIWDEFLALPGNMWAD
jgi:hypothetical protein